MRKIISLSALLIGTFIFAQVGINTTTPAVTLDVTKSSLATVADGVLINRMTGEEIKAKDALYGAAQNATLVYATSAPTPTSPKTVNITGPGFYYYDNSISRWVSVIKDNNFPKFFYMPSVLIDTTTNGPKTMNLYSLYSTQFTNPPVKSTGSSGSIPTKTSRQLEYYVTYYDTSLLRNITINEDGVMNYEVFGNASDASFMNIVFVVK